MSHAVTGNDKIISIDENTVFDGTAVYIGSEYGISEKDYPTPAAFYKAVCNKLEGRRDAVSAMTYMVDLLIKVS